MKILVSSELCYRYTAHNKHMCACAADWTRPTRMDWHAWEWQVTEMVNIVRAKLLLGNLTIYRNISEYGCNGVIKDRKA